jgi:hypothetical protein
MKAQMPNAKDRKQITVDARMLAKREKELRRELADPDRYPPGELPAVSRDELARIAAQPEQSAADIASLGSEYVRAQRKRGFFKALADKRPDADERDMSANGTVRIAEPVIQKMARHGAEALARSRHGGQKTGAAKKDEGAETKRLVLAAQEEIGSDAGAIGERVGISASQVRRLWRKPPKRNARMK